MLPASELDEQHEVVRAERVSAQLVLGLVPREWEDWVLDETRHAVRVLHEDLLADVERDDPEAAHHMRADRARLTEELALAEAASETNRAGDREKDHEWAVTGIPGIAGVALQWDVRGDYAEAQEPTGFRERRRLLPPNATSAMWTVERRMPQTPDDAEADISHRVPATALLVNVPDGLRDWVRWCTETALNDCATQLAERLSRADSEGFAGVRELAEVAEVLHAALDARAD